METLDPTVRLVLEGLLGQVPATLVTAAVIGFAGWLVQTMRARKVRRSPDPRKTGLSSVPDRARSGADSTRPRRPRSR